MSTANRKDSEEAMVYRDDDDEHEQGVITTSSSSRTSCSPTASAKFYIGTDATGHGAEFEDDQENAPNHVIVGICAMAKKADSKPMREILKRLNEFELIKTEVFPEDVILNKPVNEWPVVDCLISFHSKGFPLGKAIEYEQLRKPFIVNDLQMQYGLQDRRIVYRLLEASGIELPRYAILDRDSDSENKIIEMEDAIEVNGVLFNKPFVEKPVSAEDHNIYIYYPSTAGGGSQRLFRKIGSRSSVYSSESDVRKIGSFIYEEFMQTDGTDVKVYTVGPDYAHAEARKSPALDGKVQRDKDGKEIRFPVMLSNSEKLIARRVCQAFKQTVNGFDLLRASGKSYVCDVNGFSFVKNSCKYYDDSARILGNMILRNLAPQLHIPWLVPFQLDDPPIVPTTLGKMMELRCVVGVIRHGDRTPKQKMKMEIRHPRFFKIYEKYGGSHEGKKKFHVKLKKPKQLQEILDVARFLLNELDENHVEEIEENRSKLEQLKSVLEMYGHFSGINRKVQLKYQPRGRPKKSSSEEDVTEPKEPSLLCIVKWGGELTPKGRIQAEEMGRAFRCMYPGGQGDYSGSQGGLGFLRLHSTYRHDLKIYASDEGRVQMTAAAFAKGLLDLEGELTPILVQMVKSANTNGLLDNDCDASKLQNAVKHKVHDLMQIDRTFGYEDIEKLNNLKAPSIMHAIATVKNPVATCDLIYTYIQKLNALIKSKRNEVHFHETHLYYGETWDLMQRRWAKLEKDFKLKNGDYDISKIPDIYDCIKYDLQHNQHILQFAESHEFYSMAKSLADIVIPQEYGSTSYEKMAIGLGICTPLIKKIKTDLLSNMDEEIDDGISTESISRLNPEYSHGVSSPGRHVRTRLYFTSESHIHSLLNVIRLGGLFNEAKDEQWKRAMDYVAAISELNYLTQIVIMLYEDQTKDTSSDERFHVELHFSPGVSCCLSKNIPKGPGFRTQTTKHVQSKRLMPKVDRILSSSLPKPASIKEEEFSDLDLSDDERLSSHEISDSDPRSFESDVVTDEQNNKHSLVRSTSVNVAMIVSAKKSYSASPPLESPTIIEEPESPKQLENSPTIPKSVPIPITISTCRERKISGSDRPDDGSARNSERAHSVEPDNGKQNSDADSATSWSEGNEKCVQPGCPVKQKGHRHSIPGQLLRLYSLHNEIKKFSSQHSIFSTAVISGSSSAPNLHETLVELPGQPSVRPLETLHNALSLKHLDVFFDKMINSNQFRLPLAICSSSNSINNNNLHVSPTSFSSFSSPSITPTPGNQSSYPKYPLTPDSPAIRWNHSYSIDSTGEPEPTKTN